MTSKQVIAGLATAVLLLGLSASAMADHERGLYRASAASVNGYAYGLRRPASAVYDYAPVISSEPIVRYVTVRTPVRECWQETEYYAVHRPAPGTGVRTLVGAIVGGVIGHQFGSGSGNDAATIAGTLIGAAVGSDSARRRNDGKSYDTVEYGRPVQRCATTIREHQEERIDGYRVVYRYNGQKYATQMPYDPGREIRVRVDVQPTR
jgi:uncharacterized protein YcfJ